ncbi:MAG: glycosyltransferase [Ilumatobacter sp.]
MAAVTVVIVTFRSPPGLLERTVASVIEAGGDARILVIDNGGEATYRLGVERAAGRSLIDQVEVSVSDNDGFGAAANLGIARAIADGHEAVAVLNDDVEVAPGWIEALMAELVDPAIGAVQPLLVSTAGDLVNSAGVELDRYGAGSDRLRDEPVEAVDAAATEIDVFTGGAVLLRSAFVRDVGGFDERFFLYYEDVELALRGAAAGWRFRLAPSVRVRHHGSATTDSLGVTVVRLRERNRLWCSAMTGSADQMRRALWLSVRRVRHRPRRVHLSGLAAGVAGAVPRWFDRRRGIHRAPDLIG